MASHYLYEPGFCNPASGWENGQIEKNVPDARRRLWLPLPGFPGIDALNAWLRFHFNVHPLNTPRTGGALPKLNQLGQIRYKPNHLLNRKGP